MPEPERRPVDVNELVQKVVRLFEPQLASPGRAPIEAELDLAPGLAPASADPDLLHRALANLVVNALDAMPEGGKLTLRTRAEDRAVRIEVADTGAGLTPEERGRLFTPYYTSKRHGTGLGLAIVQSVVSDHGGRIAVASEPGRGTTFRIDLPAV
jgi:signal transduction histidine kinase